MKKMCFSILLTATFATGLVFAQRSGNPPSPADLAQRRVGFLTRQLTLTDAQQQQATTIFTNSATAAAALHDSLRTAQQSLSDAVKANNNVGIDQAAATIGTLTAQLTASDAKADAAFYQILTPDQQTKFNQSPGPGFGGRGGPGGFGRGAGPGGYRQPR